MRLGFCQFEPRFGQVEENLGTVEELIDDADFDLLVLPELFATGYQFRDREEALCLAEGRDGKTVEWAARLAKKSDAFVCGGFVERDNGKVYNSAFLAGPEGLKAVYRKIHLFNREKECFFPGDGEFEVHDIGIARVGIMICFDWIFPESMRSMALQGAQVICHPANLVLPYCQQAMKTRCLENGLFAVTANRIGTEARAPDESLSFSGQSQITAPFGRVAASVSHEFEGVRLLTIDPREADDKRLNPYNDLLADRRDEKYKVLTRGMK